MEKITAGVHPRSTQYWAGHEDTLSHLAKLEYKLRIRDNQYHDVMDWAILTNQENIIELLNNIGIPKPKECAKEKLKFKFMRINGN